MPASARHSIWGAELFKYMAHIDISAVPYRGTTALMPDLLAGRITMSFANISNVIPLAREGKLRALAITSIKRSALAPDLPTMAVLGIPSGVGGRAVVSPGRLRPAAPEEVWDRSVTPRSSPRAGDAQAQEIRRAWARADQHPAGRADCDHPGRNARMGEGNQGRRHQAC